MLGGGARAIIMGVKEDCYIGIVAIIKEVV